MESSRGMNRAASPAAGSGTTTEGAAAATVGVPMDYAQQVIESEAAAVAGLKACLNGDFERAARLVYGCSGTVVMSGIGKAGIIGEKLSATLCSTGTHSIFLHAAEAIHGDLGRVRRNDLCIVLSYGGETEEVTRLLQQLKKLGVTIIAMTGRRSSTLGGHADVVLDLGELREACPLGLAPSCSTTAMLALGDALALTVLKMRNFKPEDFALYHPGGSLGRKLLKVEEVMRQGDDVCMAPAAMSVREMLVRRTQMKRRSGAAIVIDDSGKLSGIFVDGDLRRLLTDGKGDLLDRPLTAVMTGQPKHARLGMLASEALHIMNRHEIDDLPVVDDSGRAVGMIDIQDLVAVGLAQG